MILLVEFLRKKQRQEKKTHGEFLNHTKQTEEGNEL